MAYVSDDSGEEDWTEQEQEQENEKLNVMLDPSGNPLVLYRVGDPLVLKSFWTPSSTYAIEVLGDTRIPTKAMVKSNALIYLSPKNSNYRDIQYFLNHGYDIIVFPMWDYDSDEWVIKDPDKSLIFIDHDD